MVQVDLITGFLGSGKTSFLKLYASYLISQGLNIGILENDFGAVNVDMLLLQELEGENCELEMISGGSDKETHRRRFRTKLIAMAMSGYDRIIVEPSGIYDVDEFFDALCDEPLDRLCKAGNVIAIVDAGMKETLPKQAEFILASEAACAGLVVFSKTQDVSNEKVDGVIEHLNEALENIRCSRNFKKEDIIINDWKTLTREDMERVNSCGHEKVSYLKKSFEKEAFETLYFMNHPLAKENAKRFVKEVFADKSCGKIFRVKGFVKSNDGFWFEINATENEFRMEKTARGQEIIIVIGENPVKEEIEKKL